MLTMILITLLLLAPIAHAGDPTRCTTREDPAFKRWVTECRDGARAITKWDAELQRWQTDVTNAPQADKAPRGGPGKAPQR
jgi:hypothetical protein